jgi:hypothetical protein
MVDQLVAQYNDSHLRELKASQENWVQVTLELASSPAATVRRGTPVLLVDITDAATLIAIVAGAEESSLDHEPLRTEAEVDEVSGILQDIFDWGEIWSDLEPGARVRAAFDLDRLLDSAHEAGWRVFGARARGTLSGGAGPATAWETAYIRIVRKDSGDIVTATAQDPE